jgi:pyridoxine 5-phosphate synthase
VSASSPAHTLLSVNINKYALLRNSRDQNTPDLLRAADLCLAAGAHGITVHPRRDQRHVRFTDVPALAAHMAERHPGVELNIECEPAPEILELVHAAQPAQCTLVPVRPGEVTSDHGWDLPARTDELRSPVARLKELGIRVSIFMDCDAPDAALAEAAAIGVDRIELYTGPYAHAWGTAHQQRHVDLIFHIAERAAAHGLALNAGHDLDRHNLAGIAQVPGLLEVSIGHAQIVRALDIGTTASIHELLRALGHPVGDLG